MCLKFSMNDVTWIYNLNLLIGMLIDKLINQVNVT